MQQASLHRPLLGVTIVTVLLLLVPLVAMQFTDEVYWTLSDFLVAAGLLLAAGTAIVLGTRRAKTPAGRVVVVGVIVFVLCVIWAQLAVGLFD